MAELIEDALREDTRALINVLYVPMERNKLIDALTSYVQHRNPAVMIPACSICGVVMRREDLAQYEDNGGIGYPDCHADCAWTEAMREPHESR
jgi:hypothetical protein